MRIAFDIRKLNDFGIGTYIRNLILNLANLDQEPGAVEIDGQAAALSAIHSASAPGLWTLRLPAGTHEVRVRAR